MSALQPALFGGRGEADTQLLLQQENVSALDEMFAASRRYRSSREYMRLLEFICRFPSYAPFNCMLLYTQNPSVSYVATAGTWAREFGRRPKHDARPLVILWPFSPVRFVYDLKDTEGWPVPPELLRPFETRGTLPRAAYRNTLHNSSVHGVGVREALLRHQHGGSAMWLNTALRCEHANLQLEPWMRYLVVLSKEDTLEDKYSSLVHELAHVSCGHLGIDEKAWWLDRRGVTKDEREIEAESVAYLVCRRKGLETSSERYLARYKTGAARAMPLLSLNAILLAAGYIEQMAQAKWKKPRKKSRYKAGGVA